MTPVTIVELIARLRVEIAANPDDLALKHVRDRVDAPGFRFEVRDHIRLLNDPEAFDGFALHLIGLRRSVEDRRAKLAFQREQLNLLGLGGGGALIGGSLLTAVSISLPPLALLPCAAGLYITVRSYREARRLHLEIAMCDQIVERLKIVESEIER